MAPTAKDAAAVGDFAIPSTVGNVINAAHIDHRLLLLPMDYAVTPQDFGVVEDLGFHVPAGGDRRSMHVAIEQHRAICHWYRVGQVPSAAALCRRFGISGAVFSRTIHGTRWAGGVVSAALLHATNRHPRQRSNEA